MRVDQSTEELYRLWVIQKIVKVEKPVYREPWKTGRVKP